MVDEKLEEKRPNIVQELDRLKEECSVLSAEKIRFVTTNQTLNEECKAMRKKIANCERRESKRNDFVDGTAELEKMREQSIATQKTISNLEEILKAKVETILEIEKSKARTEGKANDLQTKYNRVSEQFDKVNRISIERQEKISALQKKSETSLRENEKLQSTLNQKEKDLKIADDKMKTMEIRINDQEIRISSFDSEQMKLFDCLKEKSNEFDDLCKELQVSQENGQQLKQKLIDAENENIKLQSNLGHSHEGQAKLMEAFEAKFRQLSTSSLQKDKDLRVFEREKASLKKELNDLYLNIEPLNLQIQHLQKEHSNQLWKKHQYETEIEQLKYSLSQSERELFNFKKQIQGNAIAVKNQYEAKMIKLESDLVTEKKMNANLIEHNSRMKSQQESDAFLKYQLEEKIKQLEQALSQKERNNNCLKSQYKDQIQELKSSLSQKENKNRYLEQQNGSINRQMKDLENRVWTLDQTIKQGQKKLSKTEQENEELLEKLSEMEQLIRQYESMRQLPRQQPQHHQIVRQQQAQPHCPVHSRQYAAPTTADLFGSIIQSVAPQQQQAQQEHINIVYYIP